MSQATKLDPRSTGDSSSNVTEDYYIYILGGKPLPRHVGKLLKNMVFTLAVRTLHTSLLLAV